MPARSAYSIHARADVREHSVWTFIGPLHRKDFNEKLEKAAAWGTTAVEALVFAQLKGIWGALSRSGPSSPYRLDWSALASRPALVLP